MHSVWQCCRYRTNKQHKGGSGWLGMMLVSRMPLHSVAACCVMFSHVNKSDTQLNLPTDSPATARGGRECDHARPLAPCSRGLRGRDGGRGGHLPATAGQRTAPLARRSQRQPGVELGRRPDSSGAQTVLRTPLWSSPVARRFASSRASYRRLPLRTPLPALSRRLSFRLS